MKLVNGLITAVSGLCVAGYIYNSINKFIEEQNLKNDPNTIKCFISIPMKGKTDSEINNALFIARNDAEKIIKKQNPDKNIKIIDNFITGSNDNPANLLGLAICKLSNCEYVYFAKGWNEARGCIIEHNVATNYGKKCIYQN